MRVSKLFCLKGPAPPAIKLFSRFELVGFGRRARMFPACAEIAPIGIRNGVLQFAKLVAGVLETVNSVAPQYAVLPVPSRFGLLVGSYK